MRVSKKFFFFIAACGFLLQGCMTTTTTRARTTGSGGRPGVEVGVYKDGTITLYGNPVDKPTLAKRLRKEEQADKGRAIVLKSKDGATRSQLADLREFLVLNKIPNVTMVTTLNAAADEGESEDNFIARPVYSR